MTQLELFNKIALAPFIDPAAMRKAKEQPWRHVLGMRASYADKKAAFIEALEKQGIGPLDPVDPCEECGGHGDEGMCSYTMRYCSCCDKCVKTCKERNDIDY